MGQQSKQRAAEILQEFYLKGQNSPGPFRPDDRVKEAVDELQSDGYHTFDELYRFRLLYNAALFGFMAHMDQIEATAGHNVHKSKRHNDGKEPFGGGWFIVMATLPTGQISNHYEMEHWDLFDCEERPRADKWDGHTATEVADRIERWLNLGGPHERTS